MEYVIKIGKKKNSREFNLWALNLLEEQFEQGLFKDKEEYRKVRRLLYRYVYHEWTEEELKYNASRIRFVKEERIRLKKEMKKHE